MDKNSKNSRYSRLFIQTKELLEKSESKWSQMATLVAILHHKMDYFFWTGFYFLQNENLIVGPYQGPVACQLLAKNKGVCWAAINEEKTIVVPNVHDFSGHIACDSRSNSEIVIPVKNSDGKIVAVLDVDSKELNSFDENDKEWLEKMIGLIRWD